MGTISLFSHRLERLVFGRRAHFMIEYPGSWVVGTRVCVCVCFLLAIYGCSNCVICVGLGLAIAVNDFAVNEGFGSELLCFKVGGVPIYLFLMHVHGWC